MAGTKETLRKFGRTVMIYLLLLSLLCSTPVVHTQAAELQNGNSMEEAEQQGGNSIEKAEQSAGGHETRAVSPGDGVQAVRKGICRLNDGKLYYFNDKGVQITKKGWHKISGKCYLQMAKSGYIAAKLENTKTGWKYYKYDYKADKWRKQKDVWIYVDRKRYYFDRRGRCSKIYNPQTQKCRVYEKGKMRVLKKDICKLHNGKIYYFGKNGVRLTKKGWKKSSSKKYIQVGKSKWVTAKLQNTKGIWRYYKYSYRHKKWVKQKKTWLEADKKKYYFNGSGRCTQLYDMVSRKCYDYHNGTKTLVKSDARVVDGTEYYFGADGVRVSEAGMYLTCHGSLVYALANGTVTKKISGQIFSYSLANGKVASCRVKDGVYMCYYNGNAEPRRMIDTTRPMVALTYDDGPSQYTPEILDVLRQQGSVATFFVVGNRVASYADTVRSAQQMGCEIGNHTYSHQVLTKVGASQIQSQIGATNSAVQNVTGIAPAVMRPPGGGHSAAVRSAVGMPIIMWSIDTLDWKTRNAASTQAAVLGKVRDGDIVLMHDLYSQTAAASRVIIPELIQRGYQLVTVSELSDCRGAMANGGVYSAFR